MSIVLSTLKELSIEDIPLVSLDINGNTVWSRITYLNLVPTAIDTDGNLFNGCGYQNGVYLSSSGWQNVSADSECVTTGWMPFEYLADEEIPPIYIKGVEIDTTKSHLRGCFYNSEFAPVWGWMNGTASSTGRGVINVEQLGEKYYKLTLTKTTLNLTWMRFSFIGSGEDLVITVKDPIE